MNRNYKAYQSGTMNDLQKTCTKVTLMDKKTGEIWDSDMAVPSDYDISLDWYIKESKAMLEAFKKGEIEV